MRLTFRERITYVIYTEPYSNAGITIDKFLEIARSITGVVGGVSAGMGIRETSSKVTYNMSEFIPHVIE